MVVRRLLIALAVLIALTAIAAGVSPPPRGDDPPSSQVAPSSPDGGEEVERTINTRAKSDVKVAAGDLLRLTVEGREVDSVQVGDLEIMPLDPDSPAVFELLAEDPGRYPIRLLDADRDIGTLEISG